MLGINSTVSNGYMCVEREKDGKKRRHCYSAITDWKTKQQQRDQKKDSKLDEMDFSFVKWIHATSTMK